MERIVFGEDISADKLSDMITDAILSDNILNRNHIKGRVSAILKAFARQRDRPSNYNKTPTHNAHAARLRALEQKEFEQRYWKDKCKTLTNEADMHNCYQELGKLLIEARFTTYNTYAPKERNKYGTK